MSVSQRAQRVQAGEQTIDALQLDLSLKGLDASSADVLSALFYGTCNFDSMTVDEVSQMRAAVARLLGQGFTLTVGPVAGRTGQGDVAGSLTLELQPAPEGRLSLARQLRSQGELRISGAVLTEDQLEALQGMQLVVFEGQTLRSSFRYADGVFTLNGAPHEVPFVREGLGQLDSLLQGVLSTPRRPGARPQL